MLCPCIHKVFGSEFATDIAFDALWTLDLWHWDLWKSLSISKYHFLNPPVLRSAPKEPKEAPKAKAPAPATVPSAATARAAAAEKTKEDEAPGGCGSRCFLTF